MSYKFEAGNKTFTVNEFCDMNVKMNTGDKRKDDALVRFSGGPVVISDNLRSESGS